MWNMKTSNILCLYYKILPQFLLQSKMWVWKYPLNTFFALKGPLHNMETLVGTFCGEYHSNSTVAKSFKNAYLHLAPWSVTATWMKHGMWLTCYFKEKASSSFATLVYFFLTGHKLITYFDEGIEK